MSSGKMSLLEAYKAAQAGDGLAAKDMIERLGRAGEHLGRVHAFFECAAPDPVKGFVEQAIEALDQIYEDRSLSKLDAVLDALAGAQEIIEEGDGAEFFEDGFSQAYTSFKLAQDVLQNDELKVLGDALNQVVPGEEEGDMTDQAVEKFRLAVIARQLKYLKRGMVFNSIIKTVEGHYPLTSDELEFLIGQAEEQLSAAGEALEV